MRAQLLLAPEVRQKVAHGETVGNRIERESAPDGAKGYFKRRKFLLSPLPGLSNLRPINPRLSPWATFCRCSAAFNMAAGTLPSIRARGRGLSFRRQQLNFRKIPGNSFGIARGQFPLHDFRVRTDEKIRQWNFRRTASA